MKQLLHSSGPSDHCRKPTKAENILVVQPWELRERMNLATPVYTLPTEILKEIFCATRPSLPHQIVSYAVVISHVTRRWRNLALCTAHLWTDIYIWLHVREACLASYLQRSSNHLLDVKIELHIHYDGATLDNFRRQLPIIVSQTARLRNLIVEADVYFGYILQKFSALRAPYLETLDIRFMGGMDTHLRHTFIGGAPMLSSITVCGTSVRSCMPPLAAVTHLHLGATRAKMYPDELCDVLTSVPSLRRLILSANGVSFRLPAISWPVIRMPSLTSLTIAFILGHSTANALLYERLVAPNLEFLAVEWLANEPLLNDCRGDTNSMITDAAVINKSLPLKYPRLRSLAITVCDMDSDKFVCLCEALPSVNHVNFWQQQHNTTLPLLEYFEEIPLLWPDLRHITLSPTTFRNVDALRDVVASRICSGRPLHSVGHQSGLHDDPTLPEDNLGWLRERVKLEVDKYQLNK